MKTAFLQKTAIFSMFLVTLLSACVSDIEDIPLQTTDATASVSEVTTTEASTHQTTIEAETPPEIKLLEGMSLEQKIGQMFIIRPETLPFAPCEVGGIAIFSKNVTTPSALENLIKSAEITSEIPMFISVDEEGGRISRIADNNNFEAESFGSMKSIGKTENPENAENVGFTIGSYLKKYGLNMDFAPVADVATNPYNQVIGNRSFGSDAEIVSEMVTATISGFQRANVISCVKHFPGHGDTKEDTHTGYVSVEKTWKELLECEITPFKRAIDEGVDMVMVAHISVPNVTTDGLPCSLSQEMIEGKLREELGFNGVVITDAMEMGAVANNYSSANSAVMAVLAGNDIVLMPNDISDAFNGVYNAVQDGTISEERINESVERILKLKIKYGIIELD